MPKAPALGDARRRLIRVVTEQGKHCLDPQQLAVGLFQNRQFHFVSVDIDTIPT
jgi:hypothetical protein